MPVENENNHMLYFTINLWDFLKTKYNLCINFNIVYLLWPTKFAQKFLVLTTIIQWQRNCITILIGLKLL